MAEQLQANLILPRSPRCQVAHYKAHHGLWSIGAVFSGLTNQSGEPVLQKGQDNIGCPSLSNQLWMLVLEGVKLWKRWSPEMKILSLAGSCNICAWLSHKLAHLSTIPRETLQSLLGIFSRRTYVCIWTQCHCCHCWCSGPNIFVHL